MVFSFFGKKDPPPKPAAKTAAPKTAGAAKAAPKPPPAKPAAAKPVPANPEPAARPSAPPPPAQSGLDAPPARENLPDLDFTEERDFDPLATALEANIELQETSDKVHPVVEEAAVLFANGHDPEALRVLEAAVVRNDLGAAAEQVWLMLFDLYHVLDRRQAFEAKALEYVVCFERSPPAWTGCESAEQDSAGARAMTALPAVLDASARRQLELLGRALATSGSARVDVGKVKQADEQGCALFVEQLYGARKAGREVQVQNAAVLTRVLEAMVVSGEASNPHAWLALLELYHKQGLQEKYEECALNYAVTFEVSPPAWEMSSAKPAATQTPRPSPSVRRAIDAFELSGELAGPCTAIFEDLKRYAAERDAVVLDLAQLRRMDFVCAGNLLNTLFGLAMANKSMVLRHASAVVAGLLAVVGITQVATVERRRY